jgi:hypothetical protein
MPSGVPARSKSRVWGTFARDPDSLITFTKHEEEGAFTVEMVLANRCRRATPLPSRRPKPAIAAYGKFRS